MNDIQVSFIYWERTGQNSVTHAVTRDMLQPCLFLEPWYEENCIFFQLKHWFYKPSKYLGIKLYGPASLLSSRSIVYPCNRNGCWIACPCFLCRGYVCQTFSTEFVFEDHKIYHMATHHNCRFCCQILEKSPFFTFEKMGPWKEMIKTYSFSHCYSPNSKTFIKTFKCKQCGRRFKHSSNRERHFETVHARILRYECNICEKVFGRSDNLKRHKKIHEYEQILNNTDESDENKEKPSSSDSEESSSDFEVTSKDDDSSDNDDNRENLIDQLLEKPKVLLK